MNKSIEAKNLWAQLQYRAAGNPPSTLPDSAISNAYPGLEMDFRNVWKRILVGIELHESSNFVVAVDEDAPPEAQPLAGGNPKQITNFRDGLMTGFAWSYDNKMLAAIRGSLLRDAVLITDLR